MQQTLKGDCFISWHEFVVLFFLSFEWMLAVCRRLASSEVNEASAENFQLKKDEERLLENARGLNLLWEI